MLNQVVSKTLTRPGTRLRRGLQCSDRLRITPASSKARTLWRSPIMLRSHLRPAYGGIRRAERTKFWPPAFVAAPGHINRLVQLCHVYVG